MIDLPQTPDLKISKMRERFLSEFGLEKLCKRKIFKRLVEALSEDDITLLISNNIYFNTVYSPASVSNNITTDLKKGDKIITIDINSLEEISEEESVAIILHEIGHALNPSIQGDDAEFLADDYAKERGFKDHIISSLEKGKISNPKVYKQPITDKRIDRLRG